jgi:hypothetical protein
MDLNERLETLEKLVKLEEQLEIFKTQWFELVESATSLKKENAEMCAKNKELEAEIRVMRDVNHQTGVTESL